MKIIPTSPIIQYNNFFILMAYYGMVLRYYGMVLRYYFTVLGYYFTVLRYYGTSAARAATRRPFSKAIRTSWRATNDPVTEDSTF